MDKSAPPDVRWLSERSVLLRMFWPGLFLVFLVLNLFDRKTFHDFFGVLHIVTIAGGCWVIWRGYVRLRPFSWSEVFEEGGEWVFRRRSEEKRVSPEEVDQVSAMPNGSVVVRFKRGARRGVPLAVFTPTLRQINGDHVAIYMAQVVAKARRLQGEEERELAPLERGPTSSRWTSAVKHLPVWIIGGGWLAWVAWSWGGMAQSGDWAPFKVIAPLIVAVVGFVFHHEYLSNLADEVVLEEEGLSIRFRGEERLVPFAEIEQLEYRPFGGRRWIVLYIKKPYPWGRKIAFIPDGRGAIYGWTPQLDALAERIGKLAPSPL